MCSFTSSLRKFLFSFSDCQGNINSNFKTVCHLNSFRLLDFTLRKNSKYVVNNKYVVNTDVVKFVYTVTVEDFYLYSKINMFSKLRRFQGKVSTSYMNIKIVNVK